MRFPDIRILKIRKGTLDVTESGYPGKRAAPFRTLFREALCVPGRCTSFVGKFCDSQQREMEGGPDLVVRNTRHVPRQLSFLSQTKPGETEMGPGGGSI